MVTECGVNKSQDDLDESPTRAAATWQSALGGTVQRPNCERATLFLENASLNQEATALRSGIAPMGCRKKAC